MPSVQIKDTDGSSQSNPSPTPAHVKEADQAVLQALINEGLSASEPVKVAANGERNGNSIGGASGVGVGIGSAAGIGASLGGVGDGIANLRGEGGGAESQSQVRHDSDIKRFHALLKVLVQACILVLIPPNSQTPPMSIPSTSSSGTQTTYTNRITSDHLTPAHLGQARNTLAILQRNISLRPEVLLSYAIGSEGEPSETGMSKDQVKAAKQPLYKWILPRLLHTSSILRLMVPASSLDPLQPQSSTSKSPRRPPSASSATVQVEVSDIAIKMNECCAEIIRSIGTRIGDQADGVENGGSMSLEGLGLVRDGLRDMVAFISEITHSLSQTTTGAFVMFPYDLPPSAKVTQASDYDIPQHLSRTIKASLALTTSRVILASVRPTSHPTDSMTVSSRCRTQTPSWTAFCGDSFARCVVHIVEIVTQLNAEIQAASTLSSPSGSGSEADIDPAKAEQLESMGPRYLEFVMSRIKLRSIALGGITVVLELPGTFLESAAVRASKSLAEIALSRLRYPSTASSTPAAASRTSLQHALREESLMLRDGMEAVRSCRAGRLGGAFWYTVHTAFSKPAEHDTRELGLGGLDGLRRLDCEIFIPQLLAAYLMSPGSTIEYLARATSRNVLEDCQETIDLQADQTVVAEVRLALDAVRALKQGASGTGRGTKRKRGNSDSEADQGNREQGRLSASCIRDEQLGIAPLTVSVQGAGRSISKRSANPMDVDKPAAASETTDAWVRCWSPILDVLRTLVLDWRTPEASAAHGLIGLDLAEISLLKAGGPKSIANRVMEHVGRLAQEEGYRKSAPATHQQWMSALAAILKEILKSESAVARDPEAAIFGQTALTAWSILCQPLTTFPKDGTADKVIITCFESLKLICSFGCTEARQLDPRKNGSLVEWLTYGFAARNRRLRILSCQIIVELHRVHLQYHDDREILRRLTPVLVVMERLSSTGPMFCRETTISAYGEIAKIAQGQVLSRMLRDLILSLGSPVNAIRGIAFVQLNAAAKSQDKSVFGMVSPYLPTLAVDIMTLSMEQLNEVVQIFGFSRAAFALSNATYIVPALVISGNRSSLDNIAQVVDKHLGLLLIDHIHVILAEIYKLHRDVDVTKATTFLSKVLLDLTSGNNHREVTITNLIASCIQPLLVEIVVDFGDVDTAPAAEKALKRVHGTISPAQSRAALDLGAFLRPHMLGIISAMHEKLHDVLVKTAIPMKVKILRSLVGMIKRVGSTMATYSPQIMASFQASLAIEALRSEALTLCQVFTESLKFSDVGPNAASIIVALVAVWTDLAPSQRSVAKQIVDYILVENIDHMHAYLDEIVSLDGLAEVRLAAQRLEASRPRADLRLSLHKIITRCSNENTLVATRSLMELDVLLKRYQREVLQLAHGEKFDPVIVSMSQVLMSATARDGDASRDLRHAAYSCLGTLGALDPDRLQLRSEEPIVIQSGFGDPDEAIDFAMHLIQKVLVIAFRTTTNTKHQAHLGFAIQELLKFCGFNSKLLNQNAGSGTFSNKVRLRWAQIQKQPQLYETIWPFLEGKFTVLEVPPKRMPHPIYPHTATYREWIQRWTADLIAHVLLIDHVADPTQDRSNRAVQDAKSIFSVFRGVIRNEDVGVAHHILPHLVLYVLVFAGPEAAGEIVSEVIAVLQDQVSPKGQFSPDRRALSAQAVFDLLDHLSHWLSDQKTQMAQIIRKRKETRTNTRLDSHYMTMEAQAARVRKFLTVGIDNELVAAAALKSRAYARSLRNFEERITHLQRQQHKADDELQAYYENLHELYSALDEPDGMEGISTRVIAPNLDHQIREHETVGRWASAQSCWELCLQRSPDELNYHLGLLRCLRNIGHYDTLRTHIRGVLSYHPEWKDALAAYRVESAWTLGDWAEVGTTVDSSSVGPEISIGRVLLAMQQRDREHLPRALADARDHIGTLVSADHRQYGRAYPAVVQLHVLAEVEMIYEASRAMDKYEGVNRLTFTKQEHKTLTANLDSRLTASLPSFKHQESILSARRAAFGLLQPAHADLRNEGNLAWISSAKIARKAGYEQTAYSAILQATDAQATFAFLQHAKLLKESGQLTKALTELENGIRPLRREAPLGQAGHGVDLTDDEVTAAHNREVAKAVMLQARWAAEAGRYDHNTIVKLYREAMTLHPEAESPHYRLGHYYDTVTVADQPGFKQQELHLLTCKSYVTALTHGTKNIYQTMPRLLTLWLDTAEQAASEKPTKSKTGQSTGSTPATDVMVDLEKLITRARKTLAAYQWYTAFPQIVSRIDHSNLPTRENLSKLMAAIMLNYPRQAVWALMGAFSSNNGKGERHDRVRDVFNRAMTQEKALKNGNIMATALIADATKLCPMLLRLSEDPGIDPSWTGKATKDNKGPNQNKTTLALSEAFPYAQNYFPSKMILPLQDALTCTLPASNVPTLRHNAFPNGYVSIKGIDERVDIMPSLQRPKKLCFLGDDGRRYNFLVKPHDDLRKDARLMDFNSLINKLLVSSSESRRRNLYIRTYAVMPLNEECGLLEWVNNTIALRSILTRLYEAQNGTKIFSSEVMAWLDEARRGGPAQCGEVFAKKVIPTYQPAVFHRWFFETWPEPTAWFASRLAYARTLAVMSMVGFVLGLGDRHGENILFDSTTGDTVHVDFNCLFEKGRTFEISEKVPFRLTLNLVDGLGTTGVEGVYRKAAENTLQILRANRDSLTSVLESFVHDPLVEWEQATRRDERHKGKKAAADLRTHADRALQPIKQKLRGIGSGDPVTRVGDRARELSVQNQADALIKEATNPANLGGMYVGWAAWL